MDGLSLGFFLSKNKNDFTHCKKNIGIKCKSIWYEILLKDRCKKGGLVGPPNYRCGGSKELKKLFGKGGGEALSYFEFNAPKSLEDKIPSSFPMDMGIWEFQCLSWVTHSGPSLTTKFAWIQHKTVQKRSTCVVQCIFFLRCLAGASPFLRCGMNVKITDFFHNDDE